MAKRSQGGKRLATRRWVLGMAAAGAPATVLATGCAAGGSAPPPKDVAGRVEVWFNAFKFDEGFGAEVVQQVRRENPKLDLVANAVTGNRVEKLQVAAAAGSAPDVGEAGAWQMQEFGAAGISVPVDPYLKGSKVVKQTDVWPTLLYDLTWKNQVWGMPFGPDIAVLWVQSNLVRSAGLDPSAPPQTWDQLEQHVGRVYRADPPRVGYHPLQGSGGARAMFLLTYTQLGGQLLSADGTKATFNNEMGLKALEWLTKVCNAQGGYAAIQAATMNGNIAAGFANGTVGYMFESSDQQVRDVFRTATGLQYTTASAPIPPGGRRASVGGCHSFCITKQSKVPEGAWKFLETLSSEENNLKFAVQFNRIPIRVATAKSAAYHQNDSIRKLAVEQMDYRRWLIPAPGGTEAAALYNTLGPDVVTGKVAARDALAETERQVQQALDKWKR